MKNSQDFKLKESSCLACKSKNIKDIILIKDIYNVSQCLDCQFVFINPMPTDDFLTYYYNNFFDHEFLIRPQRTRENDEIIKIMLEAVNRDLTRKNKDIYFYELGIGKGDFIKQIADKGVVVRGQDLSKKMTGKDFMFAVDNERFEVYNYQDKFDIVYNSHVLEHSNDPAGFIGAIYKSLRPNGVAVIRVPNMSSSYNKLGKFLLGKYNWQNYLPVPDHLTIFNINNLAIFLKNNGFKIEKIKTLPLISNLLLSYVSIIARAVFFRIKPPVGLVKGKTSEVVNTKNSTFTQIMFNLLMLILTPLDKVWIMIAWPVFRRFDMGEELFVVARKI